MTLKAVSLAAAVMASLPLPGWASVTDAEAGGFEVREVVQIAAAPQRVYALLFHPDRWWSSAHTFFGDAARLSLEARPGGCFCETAADGRTAAHLRVVLTDPLKTVRLEGALGPLQSLGVAGHLTWTLTSRDGGTELVQTYEVGGYAKGGLARWSGPVDEVLGEQIARLKTVAETREP